MEEMKKKPFQGYVKKCQNEMQLLSNHINYALEELSIHLSVLITGIIVHGYNLTDLLLETLISLPKDKLGNRCDSDNYRAYVHILQNS